MSPLLKVQQTVVTAENTAEGRWLGGVGGGVEQARGSVGQNVTEVRALVCPRLLSVLFNV